MNGTGVKGGAFGFKVSSINKVRWATQRPMIPRSHTVYLARRYEVSEQHDSSALP